jgi:hexosaminidase
VGRVRSRAFCVLLLAVVVIAGCARGRPRTATARPVPPERTLVPLPSSLDEAEGAFDLTSAVVIHTGSDPRVNAIGRYLGDVIGLAAGPEPLRVESGDAPASDGIHLQLGAAADGGEEAYELLVEPTRVTITGNHPAGLFYGVQTFRQLIPAVVEFEAARFNKERPLRVHAVRISDRPRFGWRGAMLDVARHFLSVDEVKRYIDLMSLYKLNRLHLHLADDQGWRIEIKSWPNLTLHGGSTEVGGGPGGYYTQAQYADIVKYAQERFITIVPEIDMPGHTNAALASYAELNCDGVARQLYTGIKVGFSALCVDKDVTYKFIDDVVREIAAMTPGQYFHVGGDEVETLTAAQYVQFIERVQKIVQSHGKRMVGWDEIAPANLVPGTIVQHWRPDGSPAEAARRGARVIMSVASRAYIDMKYDEDTPIGLNWAAMIPVEDAYDWDPATISAGVPEPSLEGVEAPLWAETLGNIRDVEYLAFPRLAAIAEIGWTPQHARRWRDFRVRLGSHGPRWTALGINFYRAPDVPWAR